MGFSEPSLALTQSLHVEIKIIVLFIRRVSMRKVAKNELTRLSLINALTGEVQISTECPILWNNQEVALTRRAPRVAPLSTGS